MLEILATAAIVQTCSWDNPGQNSFQKTPVEALKNYVITKKQRQELTFKLQTHSYDDLVEISQDKIVGKESYDNLRWMHFGKNTICAKPDRSKWQTRLERGLVYCYGDVCVLVPTVCNNVSLVTKQKKIQDTFDVLPDQAESMPEQNSEKPKSLNFVQTQTPYLEPKYSFEYRAPGLSTPSYYSYTPAIPEPQTWVLFIAGFLVLKLFERIK